MPHGAPLVKALMLDRKKRLRSEGVELLDDWLIRAGRSSGENHGFLWVSRNIGTDLGNKRDMMGYDYISLRCNKSISFQAKSHQKAVVFNIQNPPNLAFFFRVAKETCRDRWKSSWRVLSLHLKSHSTRTKSSRSWGAPNG